MQEILSTAQMTEYLKYVAELEGSIYRQTEACAEAHRKLVKHKPILKEYVAPQKPEKEVPVKPQLILQNQSEYNKDLVKGIIAIMIAIGAFVMSTALIISWAFGIAIVLFSVIYGINRLYISCYDKSQARAKNAAAYEQYKKDLEKYENDLAQVDIRYDSSLKKYKADLSKHKSAVAKAQKDYTEKLGIAQHNFSVAKKAVETMDATLIDTKKALAEFYDLDYIFPKYRNIFAMCTIYEYFASGRCSELAGPDGAYNLYESELRQNIIIDTLDNVVKQLEQVKRNQYVLYSEMAESNKIALQMAADIRDITCSMQTIEEASVVTAQYAEITAKNTEAIKYLTLVRG